MSFHSKYTCDRCGSEKGPFYLATFRRLGKLPTDYLHDGAKFDLCQSCVKDVTKSLPREEGDGLPEAEETEDEIEWGEDVPEKREEAGKLLRFLKRFWRS